MLPDSSSSLQTEIAVVGSGAGGALTAALLAEAGRDVLVLEEGPAVDTGSMFTNSPSAFRTLYRNGGMTPIMGRPAIAYVEGRCVGGSTEISSAFWCRTPHDCSDRWKSGWGLDELSPKSMDRYTDRLESLISIAPLTGDLPPSSAAFKRGIEAKDWAYTRVPRAQKSYATGANPFTPNVKQSMSQTLIPRAKSAGAKILAGAKVRRIITGKGRAAGLRIDLTEGNATKSVTIHADHIFVCGGAIQTPLLLRRSGIKHNIGQTLRIHPMLKMAALMEETLDSHKSVLPALQVREFSPTLTLGGSVFTPGFLAMLLSENWAQNQDLMQKWRRMALYYVAVRGENQGTVMPLPFFKDAAMMRYYLSQADVRHLSEGIVRLAEVLFAAGAVAVYPSLVGQPVWHSIDDCARFLTEDIPQRSMSLSTVHAFSTCPIGENTSLCAADSFGRIHGLENLYLNDASIIPDSPGVNPQATTMMLAMRNVEKFLS